MILSIITVNLNNAEGLEKTLASVRAQTAFDQIEHIVVDGASTDGSVAVLERYADTLHFVSEKDGGIYEAMNKGVRMAQGTYLLFLNSGDWLADETVLSSLLPHLDGTPLVIGRMQGATTGIVTPICEQITLLWLYRFFIPHPATFIKRDLLEKRPYDESLRISSDWKFFVQTLVLDNVSYLSVDRIISIFDESGISSSNGSVGEKERILILKELFPEKVGASILEAAHGKNFTGSDYDRFFSTLKGYRYGRLIYSLDVLAIRSLSLFKKSATFAKAFPISLKGYE